MKWLRRRNKWVRVALIGVVLTAQLPFMVRFVPAYGLSRVLRECRAGIFCALREVLS